MLLLTDASDVIRVSSSVAVATIDVHVSWVDMVIGATTGAGGRKNTKVTSSGNTTIVPSHDGSKVRNVRAIYITNNSVGTSSVVGVEHFDGANAAELIQVVLLPGENLCYREDGSWVHRDANGAEYPPAGAGNYAGRTIQFMKTTTGSDAAGYWYSSWKDAGFPGAWSPGVPGVNGRATNGTSSADYGCLPIANPAVGANYITAVELASSVNHTHDFFDVLWVNTGLVVTTTTEQTITMPTLPARDINGTTNGEGCMIALLFLTASTLSAAGSNLTVRYTNSRGMANRTATLSPIAGSQVPATPVVGTIVWFNLQAGDTGVMSIEGITLGTSMLTGSISLMITRDIVTIGTSIPNVSVSKNIASPGIRLYNNTCLLHNMLTSATTATFIAGSLVVTER